jgi:hypothetical protein
MEFCPLLAGHGAEQAQIVAFDGEAATPLLEVANGAMPIQEQRGWLSAVAGYHDRVDRLARPDGVVPDLNGFSAVPLAVDHCSGVGQNAGDLRQPSAPKHTSRLLETCGLSQGENKTGTKVLDGVNSLDWQPPGSCDGGATL